jgi:hypothetical protein
MSEEGKWESPPGSRVAVKKGVRREVRAGTSEGLQAESLISDSISWFLQG